MLLSSVDWRHAAFAPSSDGYPGEMRLRHHYAGRTGAWFDWLYVAPETLSVHARAAGFACRVVHRFGEVYVAVLTLGADRRASALAA